MKVEHYIGIPDEYCDGVMRLLQESDTEFIPPLSHRRSTTESILCSTAVNYNGIEDYFKSLAAQYNFLLVENGEVVGLMSYQENLISSHSPLPLPNVYMSTLIVRADKRKQGYAKLLYQKLLNKYTNRHIFTRTWSTNTSHLNLLSALGFNEFLCISNDRGPGIDTVYMGLLCEDF